MFAPSFPISENLLNVFKLLMQSNWVAFVVGIAHPTILLFSLTQSTRKSYFTTQLSS